MNPLNIHRDIYNSQLISFYLDLIPVSLISLPYPYSFLTLSTILYDSVYIFYCCTFVVHCCYSLVSAVKCGYSYIGLFPFTGPTNCNWTHWVVAMMLSKCTQCHNSSLSIQSVIPSNHHCRMHPHLNSQMHPTFFQVITDCLCIINLIELEATT